MTRAILMAAVLIGVASASIGPAGQQPSADRIENAYRASNRGVARLEQFDYDAAAEAFREALKIEPTLAVARANLAIALYYAGQIDAAEKEAQAAAAALPGSAQPPYLLGLIAKGQNNSAAAIAAFKRVLEIDPEDVGARVNLGQVYLQERNTTEALPHFREAVAKEPFNVTAAYGVATTLLRAGDAEAGREAMQQFQKLRDSAYGVTYAPGYLQQGRYAEAIASTGNEPELVSEETPRVTFADATSSAFTGAPRDQASPAGGGMTLLDVDGDGDQDVLTLDGAALHLYRNDGGRFTDITAAAHLDFRVSGRSLGAVAGDYDNDGKIDLFLLTDAGPRLLHQRGDGTFEDVTSAALGTTGASASRSAAFVDVDHDGDLDLVIAGMSTPARLLRNNGNGTFTDIAATAGFTGPAAKGRAIVPTDFDNRRDIDLFVLNEDRAPALYQNMRDGTFKDVAQDVGLAAVGAARAVAAGDINKDGYTDFFIARAGQPPVFAMSDGRAHFTLRDAPAPAADAVAAQFVDYDNDGLLDLLVCGGKGLRLIRNVGTRWIDVSGAASLESSPSPGSQLAIADLDGDGDSDVITTNEKGELKIWRNEGGNRNPAIRVQLSARVSNRSGDGTKVEVRAGALREKLETASATPAVVPADVLFGLGRRATADIVRVLWPSGILQTEIVPSGGASAPSPATMKVEELDRKPSSCPFLFTWNGTRFEFVTDFLGGGEMGDWVAPGVFNEPDPDEYVRIRRNQLAPRDGRYELRITNELEEAMFLDRVQLVAIDHPVDVEVYPNEGLRSRPTPFRLYTTRGARPPARATDEHGRDVLPLIRAVDRRAPDDFAVSRIRGYADPHELTLDPGSRSDHLVLLLTGWTEYAFSSDNVAAGQAGLTLQPPRLEMKDDSGQWRTVIEDIGFPVGRPQTIAVDLTGKWIGSSRDVRIVTNMRVYWDQVLVDTSGSDVRVKTTRVSPISASLARRGFSAETSADGRLPVGYDYSRVSPIAPWKVPAGRYTRYGDVRPLLTASDDMFAIAAPGDQVALAFDATALPVLADGFTRTFLLYADGFSKEMNIRSATPDAVAPLPFHGMRRYPYGSGESYPDTRAHRDYMTRYNTRVVTSPIPSLDLSAARALQSDVGSSASAKTATAGKRSSNLGPRHDPRP